MTHCCFAHIRLEAGRRALEALSAHSETLVTAVTSRCLIDDAVTEESGNRSFLPEGYGMSNGDKKGANRGPFSSMTADSIGRRVVFETQSLPCQFSNLSTIDYH